jgi:ectoine hydroxylase
MEIRERHKRAFLREWDENGYFIIPNVMTEHLHAFRDATDQACEIKDDRRFGEKDGRPRTIWSPHWEPSIKWVEHYAKHNPIVPIIKELLGGDLYINQLHFNYKLANGGGKFNWHQDYTVFKYHDKWQDMRGLSVFFLLDDMTEENGNMHFAVGSHKDVLELQPEFDLPDSFTHAEYGDDPEHDRGKQVGSNLFTAPTYVGGEDPGKTYDVDSTIGKAGDALIFHSNIWHMSPPNVSNNNRRVFVVCYNHIDNKTEWPITNGRKDWMTLKNFDVF